MDVERSHKILESKTEDFITPRMANNDIHDYVGTLAPNFQRDLWSDTGRYCTCNRFVFCYSWGTPNLANSNFKTGLLKKTVQFLCRKEILTEQQVNLLSALQKALILSLQVFKYPWTNSSEWKLSISLFRGSTETQEIQGKLSHNNIHSSFLHHLGFR